MPVAAPFRYPEGKHGTCELRYYSDLPVLTVGGRPEEIGEAVGALALGPAPTMAGYPEDNLRHFWLGWLKRPLTWLGEKLVRQLPEEYRREMEAIARGAGLDRRRLVLGNTLFDIKKIVACSALLVEPGRSATGGPLVGRNLDYPSLGYAHEYGLVTVYRRGNGKFAFASIGFPGLVGVLSGMNEKGLTVAVLEVFQAGVFNRRLDVGGVTYGVCIRRLLESCATIDEALAALKRLRRTTMYNLVLGDANRVATFEVTTRRVVERRSYHGACLCTNHFCSTELTPLWQFNIYTTFDRHEALMAQERCVEQFGLPELHRALHASSQADETLQTMIFEPAARRLHVAVGTLPASAGPMRTLDLAPLFAA
jgi:hypothetical protein